MTMVERAEPATLAQAIQIDYGAVLRALNLNPASPDVQALVLTCREYDLDPVLGHMVLIDHKPYVTHKGLLHLANRHPAFDGMSVIDEGETQQEWWARVSVWRKDRSHPFEYRGRYPKSGRNKTYGPEMALARAECMALRRAFDVAAPVQEEQEFAAATVYTPAEPLPEPASADDRVFLEEEVARMTDEQRSVLVARWKDAGLGSLRTDAAVPLLAGQTAQAWALIHEVAADASEVGDSGPPDTEGGTDTPPADVENDRGGRGGDRPATTRPPRNRELFALLHEAGITDEERHEWASDVLGRPVTTFAGMPPDDEDALIDRLRNGQRAASESNRGER